MRRLLSLLLCLMLCLSFVPAAAAEQVGLTIIRDADEVNLGENELPILPYPGTDPGGSCGENVTWKYSQGKLTVSGSGSIQDDAASLQGWSELEITSVVFRQGVTGVGARAFAGCSSLSSFSVSSANQSFCAIDGVLYSKDGTKLVLFPCGRSGAFEIPDGVTTIGSYAFCGCDSLSTVTVPGSVTLMEESAFFGSGNPAAIRFLGDRPAGELYCIDGPQATVYYPANNATWNPPYEWGTVQSWTAVDSKPVITVQPSNTTKAEGETASFTVTASGAASYQWQYYSETYKAWYNLTNSAYSGAKTNSMSVEATAARNGFIFRCAVTNAAGTVYTNSVKLTVNCKPTITSQPSSVTKAAGETATFKVTASGATSYQWQYYSETYKAWYNLTNSAYSGAKTATMSVQATTARNGFIFRCAVTNANGTVYTNSVKLTVAAKPTITAQPQSVTKTAGETATFTVTASGAASYQWQYYSETYKAWYNLTNAAYSGAKTAAMSVEATAARNGFIFRCAVTNAAGTVYTNAVTLTVHSAPVITAQPSSVTKAAGQTATFTVTATGASSYQWQYYSETYKAWYNITNSAYSGAKTAAMSVEATAARNGYIFRCAITNAAGTVYTNSVKLTVQSAPMITAQPTNVTKAAGQTATFTVTATGASSYQWQYYSETYKAWYNITNSAYSGAKTATMSVEATAARNGYIFRCAITNAAGTVYTNAVTLTVTG